MPAPPRSYQVNSEIFRDQTALYMLQAARTSHL